MSKMSATSTRHEGSRPVAALEAIEPSNSAMAPIQDRSRIMGRSLLLSASSFTSHDKKVTSAVGFSSSLLDDESRLDKPSLQPVMQISSLTSSSFDPRNQKRKSSATNYRRMSPPKIKLKPRPPRRNQGKAKCSYKTPPPIPFLPTQSRHFSSQVLKTSQERPEEKPLPHFSSQFSSIPPVSVPCFPKTRRATMDEQNDPLGRKKKINWIGSTPDTTTPTLLASPPQLIPSFDFGLSSLGKSSTNTSSTTITTRTACKTPTTEDPERSRALLTTPSSATITGAHPPIICSSDHVSIIGSGDSTPAVVLKPLTRRLFTSPVSKRRLPQQPSATTTRKLSSNHHHQHPFKSASFPGDDNCDPHSIFRGSFNNNNNDENNDDIHGRTNSTSLSFSAGFSAFSIFSALLSSSASTIPNKLGAGFDTV